MKKLVIATGAFIASTTTAFAAECADDLQICATEVPEISALQGTAALAAVAAVLLLVWERSRRAA